MSNKLLLTILTTTIARVVVVSSSLMNQGTLDFTAHDHFVQVNRRGNWNKGMTGGRRWCESRIIKGLLEQEQQQ